MIINIILEILCLWIWFVIYMAVLVKKRGPIGALFFYPSEVGDKAIKLGLTTNKELNNRKIWAMILLLLGDLFIPYVMIVKINGANSFWQFFIQYFILFYGMEFFDWYFIDTLWVAKSDWWIIPGLEDLNYLWHDPNIKKNKMLKIIPVGILFSLVFSFICIILV